MQSDAECLLDHEKGGETNLIGLLPIMWSTGTGSDLMKPIAAPMVGGVVTSVMMELAVYPVIYFLWKSWKLKKEATSEGRLLEN